MKTSTVFVLLAVQFLLCGMICGGTLLFCWHYIDATQARADAVSSRVESLEKLTNVLQDKLAEDMRLKEGLVNANTRLSDRAHELEKQLAEVKAESKRKPNSPFTLGEPELKLDRMHALREQLMKDLGNVQVQPNGLGIAGTITINGEKLEFGEVNKLIGENVKDLLNELELGEPVPPKKVTPKEKEEKGDQF